jgi:hypothetical protein
LWFDCPRIIIEVEFNGGDSMQAIPRESRRIFRLIGNDE